MAHAGGIITAAFSALVGALIANSNGGLRRLTWDGDILWRVYLPELLRKGNALVKMGGVVPNYDDVQTEDPISDIITANGEDDAGGI